MVLSKLAQTARKSSKHDPLSYTSQCSELESGALRQFPCVWHRLWYYSNGARIYLQNSWHNSKAAATEVVDPLKLFPLYCLATAVTTDD